MPDDPPPSAPAEPMPELPSASYVRNRNSSAYRLSESVFGSLLASYVLGFVGFAAVYVQPAKKLIVTTTTDQIDVEAFLKAGKFSLRNFLQLLNIDAIDKSPGISKIADLWWYPDGIIILQYLFISTLFSTFTALLYVNYHLSIMHLSSDQRDAYIDFLLSVGVGICFGASMLFPLGVMFFLGLSTAFSLFRKKFLLDVYLLHVATVRGLVESSSDPPHLTPHRDKQNRSSQEVASAFQNSGEPTLQSWGVVAPPEIKKGTILMIVIPALIYICAKIVAYVTSVPTSIVIFTNMALILINLAVCISLNIFLGLRLRAANKSMSDDKESEDKLDRAFTAVVKGFRGDYIGTNVRPTTTSAG